MNSDDVAKYYDSFSSKLFQDYLFGNPRVDRQFCFLKDAISPNENNILIIGCGTGEIAFYLAKKVAKMAKILALDISTENINIAKSLFQHPRIEYKVADILSTSVTKNWDIVVLPDVYEHIPKHSRSVLHSVLNEILSNQGKIIFTLPSPGQQEMLHESGKELQIIDETVNLEDLQTLAKEVNGIITYFCMISIWNTNDYIHCMIERGAEKTCPIGIKDFLPLKRQQLAPYYFNRYFKKIKKWFRFQWRWYRAKYMLMRKKP